MILVQLKSFDVLCRPTEAADLVDPLTYRHGPITANQRHDILLEHGLADRREHKKRRIVQAHNENVADVGRETGASLAQCKILYIVYHDAFNM
jgi:hypothetical protein